MAFTSVLKKWHLVTRCHFFVYLLLSPLAWAGCQSTVREGLSLLAGEQFLIDSLLIDSVPSPGSLVFTILPAENKPLVVVPGNRANMLTINLEQKRVVRNLNAPRLGNYYSLHTYGDNYVGTERYEQSVTVLDSNFKRQKSTFLLERLSEKYDENIGFLGIYGDRMVAGDNIVLLLGPRGSSKEQMLAGGGYNVKLIVYNIATGAFTELPLRHPPNLATTTCTAQEPIGVFLNGPTYLAAYGARDTVQLINTQTLAHTTYCLHVPELYESPAFEMSRIFSDAEYNTHYDSKVFLLSHVLFDPYRQLTYHIVEPPLALNRTDVIVTRPDGSQPKRYVFRGHYQPYLSFVSARGLYLSRSTPTDPTYEQFSYRVADFSRAYLALQKP